MNDKTKKIHEARFLKDVSEHRMEIIRDNGIDRHIRFAREKTSAYYFDIITVPGKLFITGDCGTWAFSRITDMFDFFRTDKQDWNYNHDGGLSVNPGYWAEKLLCHDRNHSYEEFSEDVFDSAVKEMFDQYFQYEDDFSDEIKQDVWSSIEENVLNPDGEHDAYLRLQNFSYEHEDIAGRDSTFTFSFVDWANHHFTDYTSGYMWNIHAIAWAIREYDNHHESLKQQVVA